MVWVFNIWGAIDLLVAFYQGLLGVGIEPGSLGAAYFIPTVVLPPLLVTHGHGPMRDLAEDQHSIKLIESFLAAGKPIALVCHAPSALRHLKSADGRPMMEGPAAKVLLECLAKLDKC